MLKQIMLVIVLCLSLLPLTVSYASCDGFVGET